MRPTTTTEEPWLVRLLQATDSAAPTGGYAHSFGFEEIVRLGLVRDEATLLLHLQNHLWPMLANFELPMVRLAQAAALDENIAKLCELDAIAEASKAPRESREASRAMGGRRLHTLLETGTSQCLSVFAAEVKAGRSPGHHAVVFAVGLAMMPRTALLTAWAFQSLSAMCLSAPKLLRLGQDAAQRVLAAALADSEQHITHSLTMVLDDAGWFDPLLDLASMQHEIADERLFIS